MLCWTLWPISSFLTSSDQQPLDPDSMYQSKLPTFSGSHFHIDSSHVIIYISQLKLHLSLSLCLSPPFLSVSSLSSAALWLCSSAPVDPHACCLPVPPLSHSSGSSRWVAFLADSRMWNNNLLKLYIQRSIACCLPWYYAHFIHL